MVNFPSLWVLPFLTLSQADGWKTGLCRGSMLWRISRRGESFPSLMVDQMSKPSRPRLWHKRKCKKRNFFKLSLFPSFSQYWNSVIQCNTYNAHSCSFSVGSCQLLKWVAYCLGLFKSNFYLLWQWKILESNARRPLQTPEQALLTGRWNQFAFLFQTPTVKGFCLGKEHAYLKGQVRWRNGKMRQFNSSTLAWTSGWGKRKMDLMKWNS